MPGSECTHAVSRIGLRAGMPRPRAGQAAPHRSCLAGALCRPPFNTVDTVCANSRKKIEFLDLLHHDAVWGTCFELET